jgi:hypothetical protein
VVPCGLCGNPLPEPVSRFGRPRKYCGDTCRQRAQRAKNKASRTIAKGVSELKVLAVWNDDALRARWWAMIQKYRLRLNAIADNRDLPAELRGTTQFAIEEGDGRLVYRYDNHDSVASTLMQDAIAELVHDYDDDQITPKLVTRVARDRLVDAIRHSDEFVRVRVEKDDGTVRVVVKRKSFAIGLVGDTPWADSGAEVIEGEVTEVLDRGAAARMLEGDERTAYLALVISHLPTDTLGRLISHRGILPYWNDLASAIAWAILTRPDHPTIDDELAELEAEGEIGDLMEFIDPTGRSAAEINDLISRALHRVAELTDQTPGEIVSGIKLRPDDDLAGFLLTMPVTVTSG